MRNLMELQEYRDLASEFRLMGGLGGKTEGIFMLPLDYGRETLRIIASVGLGWDHISCSLAERCPTWEEMEMVRKFFTAPGEIWVQYGVPESEHINCHPYCLHWWRDLKRPARLPPAELIGPKQRDASR